MNLLDFLHNANIEDLNLPAPILQKLQAQHVTDFKKIHSALQAYRVFGKCSIKGLSEEELMILDRKYTDILVAHGLMQRKSSDTLDDREPNPALSSADKKPVIPSNGNTFLQNALNEAKEVRPNPDRNNTGSVALPTQPTSPLSLWESRLAPQLRKAELIGEVAVSREELDEISLHIRELFKKRSEEDVLKLLRGDYPATFLVFMVGHGIYGYNSGDFWPAYEQVLKRSIDHSAFGQLFEKLLPRFSKAQFRDLQAKSLRYVSLILAHGGIPVYCLKDFFSNIVLNSAIRPQLLALDGEELVQEVLKHPTYTLNTDKPVLYFLEYGGRTAANLLDRSRKMLLAWQQSQVLLSAEEAGLPVHLVGYFAEWTRENPGLFSERGTRSRLKRPQLSLDPWGLGIFLRLPSQPLSALHANDLYWRVESGDYHETIKVRTQRKGDQVETREVTLRLNELTENIVVQFAQGENSFEWKIKGYSLDHPILAFDPANGQIQNHIFARQVWLLYPRYLALSILEGDGELLEVLPDLPGEMSEFKLECWELTKAVRLSVRKLGNVFREIYVRGQEEVQKPYLDGGEVLSMELEENTGSFYVGTPPTLHIPLTKYEDIQTELSRWRIQVENIGPADPEISAEFALVDLPADICSVTDGTAVIRLATTQLFGRKPTGIYQLSIKGPLGRDAILSLKILPEFEILGMKDLYIPDAKVGAEDARFSIHTSLLDGVNVLNGSDGIQIHHQKPGLHDVTVPADISLAELLIRRETANHQFIRVPVSLRIKRLRWRLVGDDGPVENWLQKYATIPIQELLQATSPLLIVDLPAGEENQFQLRLNVRDVEGNIIQQLKPADRAVKRANRFWRFDLSKIKHILEVNDSPLVRLDLVDARNTIGHAELELPILILTRELKIKQLRTETYTSSEQHHILVTWQEQKQLRSRALILWSLFRPWQPPLVINIPDDAQGEYEFVISRKEDAEGAYRMQMVVIDPWIAAPPPPLPPARDTLGCHDFELSPAHERLKLLEQVIKSSAASQTSHFSNYIEASIITQHLGEPQASYRYLALCCGNLLPATSREILTLKAILSSTNSLALEKEFSSQIMRHEVLKRLHDDLSKGKITLSEFTSVLQLAPHYKDWSSQACEILVQLEDPKIRFRALTQLISKDIGKAVAWIIMLLRESKLSIEDAVELLYEEKPTALEQIRKIKDDPIADQLKELLSRYSPYSGLPVVRVGSWVLTDAGWGMIDEIIDPLTNISVDSFIEGEGKYNLSVRLHINETYDLTGEKALIKMASGEIVFPRASRIFICQQCPEFASAKLEIFKYHMSVVHGSSVFYPGERKNSISLSNIQFNMNPRQKNLEL